MRIAPLGNGASAEMLPYVLRDLCVDVVFVRLWCRTVFWFSLLIVLVLCCVHSELVQGASRKKKKVDQRGSPKMGYILCPGISSKLGAEFCRTDRLGVLPFSVRLKCGCQDCLRKARDLH